MDGEGFDPEWLRAEPLEVRPRGGGERFKPAHPARPSKTLKRLFQDAGIAEFERGRLPLLWRDGELIFVAGLGADVRFTDRDGERIAIEWEPDASLLEGNSVKWFDHVRSAPAPIIARRDSLDPHNNNQHGVNRSQIRRHFGRLDRAHQNVAHRVAKWHAPATRLVVVVSAMSGETDRLIDLAKEMQRAPGPARAGYGGFDRRTGHGRAAGDGVAGDGGLKAESYTGWQVTSRPIAPSPRRASESIDENKIREDLDSGTIVIVAGFQGVDERGNITTLGRGGSDTSAVAIAAAMKADECLIYTDVDGVYTTDPRIVSRSAADATITFEEMLEMA